MLFTITGENVIHFAVFTGQCLHYLNVTFGDTRDLLGHQRFIPHSIEDLFDDTDNDPAVNYIHSADYYPFEKVCKFLSKFDLIS
jgi:hypothetical protein